MPQERSVSLCYNEVRRARTDPADFKKRVDAANPAVPALVGEWLSLVEHLVRDQGVGGSNPLSPTNSFRAETFKTETLFCARFCHALERSEPLCQRGVLN